MPVNLLATLGDRFDAEALAGAQRAAEARGYRLVRAAPSDDRLAAWIDWRFAPSWWSSETRAGEAWYALTAAGEIAGFAAFGSAARTYPWLRAYRSRSDVAVFGPFGVDVAHRASGVGAALLTASLASLRERAALALIPAVGAERLIAMYVERTGARIADTYDDVVPAARAAIFASGNGSNAQAVIDDVKAGRLALDLCVVTNDRAARVRERARRAGIPAHVIEWDRAREERHAFDGRVIDAVAAFQPDLVLLLGWMHLLPPAFLARFHETLNVHPAFLPFDPACDDVVMPDGSRLPAFRGARAPQATIAARARWSGASVHRVTAAADRGEILVRTPVRLDEGTTLKTLREAVRPLEHAAVEKAIRRWSFERG